jgi:CubicO group peptidase (beta-lactamase class C family)
MKTYRLIPLMLAAGLLLLAACLAQRTAPQEPTGEPITRLLDRAESIAKRRCGDGTLHGAVAILRPGSDPRKLFSGAISYPDGSQIDGSTRFRIASLTKIITRIAVLRLAEQGLLSLDDPLAKHRPGLHADWAQQITIRQLLSFRSGLPRERSGASDPVEAGVILDEQGRGLPFLDDLTGDGPTLEPGSRVLYSNLGYFHLGGVIEAVTGQPIEDALRDLVFLPAGMVRTGLGDADRGDGSNLAIGHGIAEDGSPAAVPPFPIEARYTAGGLVSTLDDFVALSEALLQGGLLNDTSMALLMSEFSGDQNSTLRVAGLVPGFANVWSISTEPPTAVILFNNVVGANPQDIVSAHDQIASVLRAPPNTNSPQAAVRKEEGWRPLLDENDWPTHPLMAGAKEFLSVSMHGNAEAIYQAGLTVRGQSDDAIDQESRDAYRWMASYQAALRDRYGPFRLAWWRPGEAGAFEFLFEGPDGRAIRIKLRPSSADPAVTSTLSVATVGFDADSSLYEGFPGD